MSKDTRNYLNQQLQIAWAESNSLRLFGLTTDLERSHARVRIRDIQSCLDQAQQALDDLADHVAELEEAPF